jgi:hypothetical protein
MKRAIAVVMAAIFASSLGCSSDEPEIVEVSGTVTRGGKPVPGLIVHFQPEGGRPSWGETDKQGRFELDYDPEHRGARVGKHKVFFELGSGGGGGPAEPGASAVASSTEQREIIKKYGSRDASPLTVDVAEAGQVIELKVD